MWTHGTRKTTELRNFHAHLSTHYWKKKKRSVSSAAGWWLHARPGVQVKDHLTAATTASFQQQHISFSSCTFILPLNSQWGKRPHWHQHPPQALSWSCQSKGCKVDTFAVQQVFLKHTSVYMCGFLSLARYCVHTVSVHLNTTKLLHTRSHTQRLQPFSFPWICCVHKKTNDWWWEGCFPFRGESESEDESLLQHEWVNPSA